MSIVCTYAVVHTSVCTEARIRQWVTSSITHSSYPWIQDLFLNLKLMLQDPAILLPLFHLELGSQVCGKHLAQFVGAGS